ARRLHEDKIVLHDEIGWLYELYAHLLSEEGVLEISAVELAGRQDDDMRLIDPVRRKVPKHVEKARRVVVHRTDRHLLENPRECAFENVSVLKNVAHARRTADVVLQNQHFSRSVAN